MTASYDAADSDRPASRLLGGGQSFTFTVEAGDAIRAADAAVDRVHDATATLTDQARIRRVHIIVSEEE